MECALAPLPSARAGRTPCAPRSFCAYTLLKKRPIKQRSLDNGKGHALDLCKLAAQYPRVEKQGLEQMERQVDRLEHYPDYKSLLQQHIEVTRQQLERLEKALGDAGESYSSIKESVTSAAGSVGAAVHATAQDETLKNLYAGYAYQYEQIGAYRSLITIARAAGEVTHIPAFEQSLQEEEQAAQRAAALIEPVTMRYIELTTSGQKANG
jgi:ferritin-like metal-binding protein YciE